MTDATLALPLPTGKLRRPLVLLGLGLLLALLLILSLGIGAVKLTPWQVVRGLLAPEADERAALVLHAIRLPRTLLAALVGACLAGAGAAMQGLFRNPLADPGLIGVSSGAAVAAVAAIVFGGFFPFFAGPALVPFAAFIGSLLATGTVLLLAQRFQSGTVRASSVAGLLLAGLAMTVITMAGVGFMTYLSDDRQMRDITYWSLGSVASGGWRGVGWVFPAALLCLGGLLSQARKLDALALGEREAAHLGVNVARLRRVLVIAAALGVGAATAFCGVIGFLGLLAPHLARMLLGAGHRFVLPGSMVIGAGLLVLADIGARTLLAPAELPVGLLTNLIGGGFFLWLLLRKRGGGIA
jgi:iron complex transport system permease protein